MERVHTACAHDNTHPHTDVCEQKLHTVQSILRCSDWEVRRCPLVYLIRIWITGCLDFPGGLRKQVFLDEVIACHEAPPPPLLELSLRHQEGFFFKTKKKTLFEGLLCRFKLERQRSHLSRRFVCAHLSSTHLHMRLNYDVTEMGSLLRHPACRITQQTDLKELISSL